MVSLTKRSRVRDSTLGGAAGFWASKILEEIGRGDLVDAAQLGVSELVTNALIHSDAAGRSGSAAPSTTRASKWSTSPPAPPQRTPLPEIEDVDDLNVTTFGRGLDLAAMMSSRRAGTSRTTGSSKSVWFELTVEGKVDPYCEGELLRSTEVPSTARKSLTPSDCPIGCCACLPRCSASSAATTSSSSASCGCWR